MKLNNIYSSNMLFQRDMPYLISGMAYGEITIKLLDKSGITVICESFNADGNFSFKMPEMAGGFDFYTITVTDGKEEIKLENILFGDLYLTAGQSNMCYLTKFVSNTEGIISDSQKSGIRFLNITDNFYVDGELNRPHEKQNELTADFKWRILKDECVTELPALPLMFALKLQTKADVPVGIIMTAVGGVSIDSYIGREYIEKDKSAKDYLIRKNWYIPPDADYYNFDRTAYSKTGGIFNEKIYPLRFFKFKAMLWYQGENSSAEYLWRMHETLLKLMVTSYREIFGENLPFFTCHTVLTYYPQNPLAYNYVNEDMQVIELPNYYVIPNYDSPLEWYKDDGTTNYIPIHPINKVKLAQKFADSIYFNLYKNKRYLFPYIKKVEKDGGNLICTVKETGEGLEKTDNLYGFTIAGADGKYIKANAEIIGKNKVKVYSEYILKPKYLTYAFCLYNNECNLKTVDGRIVMPFRSNREECEGKNYFYCLPYMYCDFPLSWENNFSCIAGGGFYRDSFINGSITQFNSFKLTYNSNEKIKGKTSLEASFDFEKNKIRYGGISPNNTLNGCILNFNNFNYLSLYMKADGDALFNGLLLKTHKNIVYRFLINDNGNILHNIKLGEGFKRVTVDLMNVLNVEDIFLTDIRQIKSEISNMEFIFMLNGKGNIFIDDITFHN